MRKKYCFRPLSEGELAFVTGMRRNQRSLGQGQILQLSGKPQKEIFTLIEGWASGYHVLPTGRRSLQDVFLPGDIIGLGPYFAEGPPYLAEALTPIRVCTLDAQSLPKLTKEHPDLAVSLMRLLADYSRRWHTRATLLALREPKQRLAYLFLDIFIRLKAIGIADATMCPFYLRRAHLAEAIGLSEVHVSRTLSQLRKAGLVELTPNLLVIPDAAKLAEQTKIPMPTQMTNRPIL
jgi:CRP-like cAMP-binding protein